MTTHLRARALQAGAFLALVGGLVAAVPSAALAVGPNVQITSVSSGSIPSGGKTTVKFRVTNPNLATPSAAHIVKVVVSAADMSCSGSCDFDEEIPAGGGNKTFEATLTHTGNVGAGEARPISVQISATIDDPVAGGSGSASRTVTVRGEDKPQTVRLVSGKVKDQEGKAVSGATVALRDSKGNEYNTTSNGSGGYSFTSSDNDPIAVGSLFVGATKTGYEVDSVTARGGAGQSVTIPLTIKLKNLPTSSTPSATASLSAPPTQEVTDDETPAEEETAATTDTTKAAGEDSDSGSMLYIILGVLLVAAGVGAIVLVLMRRKSGDDPEDDTDGAKSGPVTPTQGGRYGGADETRLAPAVGGRGNDATMIAPRSGAPSMADAPTMIHQTGPVTPPADEFPDPYGAPMPQGSGAWGNNGAAVAGAAAGGTYGAAQANGNYGAPTQFGAPPVPAQSGGFPAQNGFPEQNADNGYGADNYGAPADNGYGDQNGYDQAAGAYGDYGTPEQEQRYDEPTGMYRPEANGGYPQEAGYGDQAGYGGEQAGYGQNDGYGQGADEYAAQGQNGAYQGGGYQGGTYGAAAESTDQGGYDSWDGQGGGIDNGNAYGAPAGDGTYGGGTYGGDYGSPAAAPAGGTYGAAAPAPAGGNYGAPAPAPAGGTYGAAAPAPADGNYGAPADGTYGAPAGGNYGAPAPAGGNYGAAAPAPAGTYGAPAGGGTYGGAPAGGGTYGAPAGGGTYGAPAGGGYGDEQQGGAGPANGYGGDQGGYDQHDGYGGGQANGYGGQQVPPQQGGYADQGGYGGEQQGGYYGGGGEQQQGGRHGGQPRQQPEPAQRRQLDWLDD